MKALKAARNQPWHLFAKPARSMRGVQTPAPASGIRTGLYGGTTANGLTAADDGTNLLTPPDTTGAIGPNNYVEFVNDEIAVYNRSLGLVSGDKESAQTFTNESMNPMADPQIQWDNTSQRWFYVILAQTIRAAP